jgi:hypothetical protein
MPCWLCLTGFLQLCKNNLIMQIKADLRDSL